MAQSEGFIKFEVEVSTIQNTQYSQIFGLV